MERRGRRTWTHAIDALDAVVAGYWHQSTAHSLLDECARHACSVARRDDGFLEGQTGRVFAGRVEVMGE